MPPLSGLQIDPRFQRQKQRALSVDPSQKAIPSVGRVAGKRSAELATEQLESRRTGGALKLARDRLNVRRDLGEGRIALGEARLDAQDRQFQGELGLINEKLDVARKQGRIATGISIAGLGLEGMNTVVKIKDAKVQAASINKLTENMRAFANRPDATPEDISRYYDTTLLKLLFEAKNSGA